MIDGFVCLLGNDLPRLSFTAGSAIAAGDLVAISTDDKVDTVAENGTAALGWALTAAADTETVQVVLALPGVYKWMKLTSTAYSAPMLGRFYAMGAANTLDLGDTSNDLFVPAKYDAENARMLVGVTPKALQLSGTLEAA
jgi:hypothetical protein